MDAVTTVDELRTQIGALFCRALGSIPPQMSDQQPLQGAFSLCMSPLTDRRPRPALDTVHRGRMLDARRPLIHGRTL